MVAGGMLTNFEDEDDQIIDQSSKSLHLQQEPPQASGKMIYMMCVLSAMGGFLFGYDTGIVSGAMVFVRKIFDLNSLWQELVVSITIFGAWMLSLVSGSLSERYGRKNLILWASVIFTLGSIVMCVAEDKYALLAGRLVVGMAIGLASTIVPMYIAESAPTHIRGSLVTLNVCFITFGQLTAAVTAGAFSHDHQNGWRWMLGLAAVPAVIQFVGFSFMPESPRWLIRRQRDDEALEALKKIRGHESPSVLREFERIRQNQVGLLASEQRRKDQKRNMLLATLRKTGTRRALTVGCLLMAAQQLAGINTVMYYTATIIEMSGVESQSIAVWLAVPPAVVYVIFSFVGYFLADRMGRRTLLLGSLLGVIISLVLLGSGFLLASMDQLPADIRNLTTLEECYTKEDCTSCVAEPKCGFCFNAETLADASCLEANLNSPEQSTGGPCVNSTIDPEVEFLFTYLICPTKPKTGIQVNTWLVLGGLILYLASFAPGMSPMPWTINSEIYPAWARSFCNSMATGVVWMFNLLISLTFISLTETITTHGTFFLYAVISTFFWIVLYLMLPETRGRTLEDMGALFARPTKQAEAQGIMDDNSSNGTDSTLVASTTKSNPLSQINAGFTSDLTKQSTCPLDVNSIPSSRPFEENGGPKFSPLASINLNSSDLVDETEIETTRRMDSGRLL